jgi:hypothetical protein
MLWCGLLVFQWKFRTDWNYSRQKSDTFISFGLELCAFSIFWDAWHDFFGQEFDRELFAHQFYIVHSIGWLSDSHDRDEFDFFVSLLFNCFMHRRKWYLFFFISSGFGVVQSIQ